MTDTAGTAGVTGTAGGFAAIVGTLDCPGLAHRAGTATSADVTAALNRPRLELADLAVLLSPAASERLEELARRARAVTIQRFGRVIRLFSPLYLSNHCLSSCVYCGFARSLPVARRTLSLAEVEREARYLAGLGFAHLLLVSGEHRVEVSPEYLVDCVRTLRSFVPSVSIETQTWAPQVYQRFLDAGLEGVVHYQETYDRRRYAEVHPAGWKRDFDRRLSAVDSAGQLGARRIGIGVLLGLAEDWRADVLALGAHAAHLIRSAWRSEVTVAVPRINPSASAFQASVSVDDRTYTQVLAALRLFVPDAGIVLSTRERPGLRDGLARIAVTHLSASASTEPGGHLSGGRAQAQFDIADERSAAEVAAMVAAAGYDPVFHDVVNLPPPRRGTPVGVAG